MHARIAQSNRRRGFSLIELLVVVGVVGVLLASLTVAGSTAIYSARAKNTRQVIANVEFALEVFREENPLRLSYDRPGGTTFGPYPPYQLANWNAAGFTQNSFDPDSVAQLVEPQAPVGGGRGRQYRLSDRLWRDFGGQTGAKRDWVRFGSDDNGLQANDFDGFDDNRALAAYLEAFSPGALQLPNWARKPLNEDPSRPDQINLSGSGQEPGEEDSGWTDVLGIYDAWGVPLDYFHYVKIDWTYERGFPGGQYRAGYFITDRRPALRSLGMDRDTFDAWVASGRDDTLGYNRRENWIFGEQMPRPFFTGLVSGSPGNLDRSQQASGWVAAKARLGRDVVNGDNGKDYPYVPEQR